MVARGGPGRARISATAIALGVALALPGSATAAFPGANGRIEFEVTNQDFDQLIADVRPGQRPRRLTRIPRACRRRDPDPAWYDRGPRYSPDGNWVVYTQTEVPARAGTTRSSLLLL
jgi:hypothetical protein